MMSRVTLDLKKQADSLCNQQVPFISIEFDPTDDAQPFETVDVGFL
jgi:hypothetical protein